jgi:putative ABC transport system substrate-binding protein
MRRREFIALLGSATAWPLAARAQQPDRVRRIGVLMGFAESDPEGQADIAAFRDGLQKLGWTEGRNIRIDTRWATPADAESMQRFAKELVALQLDLILSHTTPTTAALLQQTRTIPIIFANVGDPVGSGMCSTTRSGFASTSHSRRGVRFSSAARPVAASPLWPTLLPRAPGGTTPSGP